MATSCKDFVVVAETAKGQASDLAVELLSLARRLAEASGGTVSAAVFDKPSSACIAELSSRGADRIIAISDTHADGYEAERWLVAIPRLLSEFGPAHILLGHTTLGAELGPRLAFRLGGAIATGCERVDLEGGTLRAVRPCFGNKAREAIALQVCPAVMTVRGRMYDPLPTSQRETKIIELVLPADAAAATTVVDRKVEAAAEGARLEKAKIVIAGGRGVGSADGFHVLEKLAAVVGGAVGASRVACDLGWVPHSRQIGLSGKTVSPDLYVAIGISGASQHMAGCGKARAILAINSDPEAAIFKEATFGVVGDYKEIIPALIEAIGAVR